MNLQIEPITKIAKALAHNERVRRLLWTAAIIAHAALAARFGWFYGVIVLVPILVIYSKSSSTEQLTEKASALLDHAFSMKDRAISLLDLEKKQTHQENAEILKKQLINKVPEFSASEVAPLKLSKIDKAVLTSACLAIMLQFLIPQHVPGGRYSAELSEIKKILEDPKAVPTPVAAALSKLAEALEGDAAQDGEEASLEEALEAAQAAIQQEENKAEQTTPTPEPTAEPSPEPTAEPSAEPTPEQDQDQQQKKDQQQKNESQDKKDSEKKGEQGKEGDQGEDGKEGQKGSKQGQEGQSGDGEQKKEDGKSGKQGKEGQSGQGDQKGNNQQGGQKKDGDKSGKGGQGSESKDPMQAAKDALQKIGEKMEGKDQAKDQPGEGGKDGAKPDSGDPKSGKDQKQNKQGKDKKEGEQKGEGKGKDPSPAAEQPGEKPGEKDSDENPESKPAPVGAIGKDEKAKRFEEEGDGPAGLGGDKGYNEFTLKENEEKTDNRYTGKEGEKADNKAPARPKTEISEVELAKPKPIKDAESQGIPLEYKDMME